jgi:hypothetical protein
MPQVKLLLPKRRLRPRTFRAAAGQTVLVGGVARIDVLRSPGATLYLTVWASDELACHFGKTEGAHDRCAAPTQTLFRSRSSILEIISQQNPCFHYMYRHIGIVHPLMASWRPTTSMPCHAHAHELTSAGASGDKLV